MVNITSLDHVMLSVTFISSALYGILVATFFRSMAALLNPIHGGTEGIKWRLVTYTAVMFSFATVFTVISLIRRTPYLSRLPLLETLPLLVLPDLMFLLNYWLADGLLLYRCYVIHAMNRWVIAFPCLVYLATVAMGILLLVEQVQSGYEKALTSSSFSLPYFSTSVFLNILLTLMIVIRLILHTRNVRIAVGGTGAAGLYKAIVVMLTESCALYTVSSLLVIVSFTRYGASSAFLPILAETQVIAPLLVIRRVANRSALTSSAVTSGRNSEFRARSRRDSTDGGSATLPSGGTTSSVDEYEMNSGGVGAGAEISVELRDQDKT